MLGSDKSRSYCSDAHDPKYRKPTLSEARAKIAKLAGEEIAGALASHNPAAIVEGKGLPYQPTCR